MTFAMFVSASIVAFFATLAAAATRAANSTACTVTTFADVPAATASCTNIVLDNIAVPAGQTLDLSKLLTGTTVTFSGTTTWGFEERNYDLITVGGTDFTITATPDAVIDGNGQAWWDGLGSNGGIAKPNHFMTVKAKGTSFIQGLYIQNYPVHCFSVSGDGLTMQNIVLNNTAGEAPNNRSNGLAAAHNSDGFDLSSSTNMLIQNNTVLNQDDCVAVTSGNNITVRNMYCDGSHGLSIGSVGGKSNNNVTNIFFSDSVILNSQNGCRIKTNSNTTGFVSGISYENIFLANISIYGIDIQQDYLNGGPTGNPTNGVFVGNVSFKNVTGTVQSQARDYYVLCGEGSCENFSFEDVSITGGTNDSCNFGGCPIV